MKTVSKIALLSCTSATLIACGGGSITPPEDGGGVTPPQTSLTPEDLTWVSTSIGAYYATDIGITGQGSIVAILDTGIDWSHEAFVNTNIAGNYGTNGIDINDGDGHGTAMASTIVGVYSDGTVFGIAPNTSILNIDAMEDQPIWGGGGFADDDLSDGIYYAVNNGADIISMSLGWDYSGATQYYSISEIAQMQDVQAISYATSQGVIVVMAAGNEAETTTGFPAYFAGSDIYNGLGIAVVAVDDQNEIAYFSTNCNTVDPTYCLAAPGEGIPQADVDGEYFYGNGTSPATAIVSGSFALLHEYFPELSPEDIVQIMLMTATDLGDPGVDDTYGSGLVNLEAALQPVGDTMLGNNQNTTEFEQAQVTTSSAMTGVFQNVAALENIPIFDMFNRKYALNFSNVGTKKGPSVDKMATEDRYLLDTELSTELLGQNVNFGLAYGDLTDWFSQDDTLINVNTSIDVNPFLFVQDFVGAAKITRAVAKNYSSASVFADSQGDQNLVLVSHTQYLGNVDLGVGFSRLKEQSEFLGSSLSGGFGSIDSATTDSVHLGIGWSNHKYGLAARGNISNTQVNMEQAGLITGFEDVTSNSWAIGAHVNGIIRQGDRLDFGVGQSLVVSDGHAILDQNAMGSAQSISLTPDGKETTYELGYRAPITDNIALLLNASYLTEADNIADAKDESNIGLRFEFTF